jgi:hypothetical protein
MSPNKNHHLVPNTISDENNSKSAHKYGNNNTHTPDKNIELTSITDDESITKNSREDTKNRYKSDNDSNSEESNRKNRTAKNDTIQKWKELFRNTKDNVILNWNSKQQHLNRGTNHKQTKIFDQSAHLTANLPFGDDVTAHSECEGILFHNINGIKDEHNWYQINTTMKELNMSGFGLAETNTSMKGYLFHKWNDITRKTFKVSRTTSSESNVQTETDEYKPGGMITVMVDKWQARVTKMGSNERGLGRWSYMIISSNKHNLVILTVYKPCKTTGPNTAWTQQSYEWTETRYQGNRKLSERRLPKI